MAQRGPIACDYSCLTLADNSNAGAPKPKAPAGLASASLLVLISPWRCCTKVCEITIPRLLGGASASASQTLGKRARRPVVPQFKISGRRFL